MEVSDLSAEALAAALPRRPIRTYPALLSTEADALAWARASAPTGAVVVSDYQASPRGRAGFEWRVRQGEDLGFSVVLRPSLSPQREGWLYTLASCALADVLGEETTLVWPDEARRGGERVGAVAVQAELGLERVEWAVVSMLITPAPRPRVPLLARLLEALEAREKDASAPVLEDYARRCETLGRRVRARLIPLGPGGTEVSGRAARVLADGALLIETENGRRIAVRPQSLGLLEEGA